ncbi:MAG: hypothetical protein KF729_38335 [Sandaracinaceae bacterium]|nr:hypothetical protein [Sandaracinaceae bacterium]
MRFASLVLASLLLPATAAAHGRPAFVGQIVFHPTDPDVIVARGTWGLAITEDGGASWRWLCAAVAGVDATREDPAILVTPDGSILFGTYDGLARSTPDRCAFERPAALDGRFVIDLAPDASEPSVVWAIATSGGEPDEVFRSADEGRTFRRVGMPVDEILLERVRVAPSDPSRVYLSGAIPVVAIRYDGGVPDGGPATTERRGMLLRSRDGGERFEVIEVPLLDEERNVHLLAVDPTDPDRLLVRMTRRIIDPREERVVLSEDGGETWTTVMSARQISGGAFSAGGARAWVSSRVLDGLFRSDDAGRSFSQLEQLSMPCVAARGDEVWACVDELVHGYSAVRSSDGGDTLETALRFSDLYELVECSRCTPVGHLCPQWFPDLVYDLRLDASTGGEFLDGSTGGPRDAGTLPGECGMDGSVPARDAGPGGGDDGCGCRAAGRGGPAPSWLVGLALFAALRRRG